MPDRDSCRDTPAATPGWARVALAQDVVQHITQLVISTGGRETNRLRSGVAFHAPLLNADSDILLEAAARSVLANVMSCRPALAVRSRRARHKGDHGHALSSLPYVQFNFNSIVSPLSNDG